MSITTYGWGGMAPVVQPTLRAHIALNAVLPALGLRFLVTPSADPSYEGTIIQWSEINSDVFHEAGPEDAGNMITVTGLEAERIYVFVPFAYDATLARGPAGNIILATWPINVISMPQLGLNSQGLNDLWIMINRKVDSRELTTTLNRMTEAVRGIISDRGLLDRRLEILEREIAILRRKIGS